VTLILDIKTKGSPTHVNTETLTTGPMIPSRTNSPPVARVIDPVIETLNTGPMIPSGTNSPPVATTTDIGDADFRYPIWLTCFQRHLISLAF
jgi:hypothetical protein